MSIEKRKVVYILMGCSAFILALFRHMYILNPNLGWSESAALSMFFMELLPVLIGAVVAISFMSPKDETYKRSDYVFLIVLSGILYILSYLVAVFKFDDLLPLYMPYRIAPLTPYFAIIPVTMTYFLLEGKGQIQTWITVLVMTLLVVISALLPQSFTGILMLLLVCCVVFGIKGAKEKKFNWIFIGAIVLLAIASAIIAYLVSGCSSVEHFILAQYENEMSYVEGEWQSAAIFDGTLNEAVKSVGFISGTQSDITPIWTGSWNSPINVLLVYGWLPYILHLVSGVIIVVCSAILALSLKNEILKNIGYLITAKLAATTLFAYLIFPRTAAPLGIRTSHIDFDLLWILVLLIFTVSEHMNSKQRISEEKSEKEIQKEI